MTEQVAPSFRYLIEGTREREQRVRERPAARRNIAQDIHGVGRLDVRLLYSGCQMEAQAVQELRSKPVGLIPNLQRERPCPIAPAD